MVWVSEKGGSRGGVPQKGKGTVERCMGRSPGKHSKEGGKTKGGQMNLQNAKRSVAEHWDRKVRHS